MPPTATEPTTASAPTPEATAARVVAALAVALLSGGLSALQARVNGDLGHALGDGFVAALWSFGSGWVFVAGALMLSRRGRAGFRGIPTSLRDGSLRWWYLIGGVGGALLVLAQSLTVGLIGVALFTIAIVAGQTVSGLAIDTRGLGRVSPVRLTPARLTGAIIVLAAVVVSVAPRIAGDVPAVVLLLPVVAGLGVGFQQAVNGQVRTTTGSPTVATFVNFTAGTSLLALVTLVQVLLAGPPTRLAVSNPWDLSGGLVGAVFIAGLAIAVPILGVLVMTLAAVSGQVICSLVLGAIAHDPSSPVDGWTLAGAGLTLLGVVVVSVRRRSRASATLDR